VHGRRVIRREWRNTDGQLHRTPGPAVENWTVLPGGARALSFQAWYVNGVLHREGRPARRRWNVENNGTRVLECEKWWRRGMRHRGGGPSYRTLIVGPARTRTLAWEEWCVNEKLHRADGPALNGRRFYWHARQVREEDLPWLRRGQGPLAAMQRIHGGGGSGAPPAWSRDARVTTVTWHGGGGGQDAVGATYRSAVGGSVLLCV